MKKRTGQFLALCLCLILTACGGEGTREPLVSTADLARAVLESQADRTELKVLEGEDLTDRLTAFYGLEQWEEAAVYTAGGVDAREIAVIRFADAETAEVGADVLEGYRQGRVGDFFGYDAQATELLEGAGVIASGPYAALLVCDDLSAAEAALEDALAGGGTPAPEPVETVVGTGPVGPAETQAAQEVVAPLSTESPDPTPRAVVNPGLDISDFPPFHPPGETVMEHYDTSDIQTAWETGEVSQLSRKDQDILARCQEVLGELVTEDMTDFEKELAVHDWMLDWGSYDQTTHTTADHSGREGYRDPYGILVGGYGNCLGYSSTFQLLMDLTGVECITVVGASNDSTGDHAWNMVRLDGEWYCVDVTWDDPTMRGGPSPSVRHQFFNVTSDRMRGSSHQWDYLYVPETTATYYRWDGVSDLPQRRES